MFIVSVIKPRLGHEGDTDAKCEAAGEDEALTTLHGAGAHQDLKIKCGARKTGRV